MEKGNIISTR
jgi:hypothetical protein